MASRLLAHIDKDARTGEREGMERGREVEGDHQRALAAMEGCFLSSVAQPGDGGRAPSDQEQGPIVLPGPSRAAVYGHLCGFHGPPPPSPSSSSSAPFGGNPAAKADLASRIHSLAERRRRQRINGHLSTLRRMIPNADKMDKASLLRSVIQEVKVLKRKAADVGKRFPVPSETNQVSVECSRGSEPAGCASSPFPDLIRASVCCDDRPDLLADITEALHCLGLRVVRADMVALGGRVRHAFLLRSAAGEEGPCPSSVIEATREVLGRVASTEDTDWGSLSTTRRRRLFPNA